ncbi:SDR family NAD(P)-dependent oxidoreductase [Nonomuraea sp. NPDC052265]|uniref:SDR family NAD(P)-dependent oxidoreductase n=1 Tax=Nonomuraea sp. NPDC052265 TaxID=3364374 RepID=UPI0037C9FFD8
MSSRAASRWGSTAPRSDSRVGKAASFAADVRDRDRLLAALDAVTERFGGIDVLYYGAASTDLDAPRRSITETTAADTREAMDMVYPAIDAVGSVLPGMIERGEGGLLFAGGLSAVLPMPALGGLALSSAALRNYAVTLNAALAEKGVYAGCLTKRRCSGWGRTRLRRRSDRRVGDRRGLADTGLVPTGPLPDAGRLRSRLRGRRTDRSVHGARLLSLVPRRWPLSAGLLLRGVHPLINRRTGR